MKTLAKPVAHGGPAASKQRHWRSQLHTRGTALEEPVTVNYRNSSSSLPSLARGEGVGSSDL
jgi:hypothetical protein